MTEQANLSPEIPPESIIPQKRFKFPSWRRLLRWAAIFVVTAIVFLSVILPFAIGFIATVAPRSSVVDAPDGFQNVSLITADNVELAGWYAPPMNGVVIIVVHGASGSRNSIRNHAQMLVDNDYGVLAFDLRGHGESDGGKNLFGWNGSQDVGAAIRYLQGQDDVIAIGGLGLSLGGETLLGAAGEYPELQAIVSDGASYRSLEEVKALPSRRSIFNTLSPWIMFNSLRLFSGDKPPTPILDSITAADGTSFLLIAAGTSAEEIDYNTLFAEAIGEQRADLWIVPDAGHTAGFSRYPEDYEQRVIDFFEQTLINE
jgi:pimeloyl-ACP methyl ester carboxylesterase